MSDDRVSKQTDDVTHRLREFYDSLTSMTDDELFEALHSYNVAFVAIANGAGEDGHEEFLHKGSYAQLELGRRYPEELEELLAERYKTWLTRNLKVDPWLVDTLQC